MEFQDAIKEELLAVKAQLEQKMDRLEVVDPKDSAAVRLERESITFNSRQRKRHTPEVLDDIHDETVLREILGDILHNIDMLFDTKADSNAVQRALAGT